MTRHMMLGKRFGRLRVLAREGNLYGGPAYRCACACGADIVAAGRNLRSGNTKSCGCLHRERVSRSNSGKHRHVMLAGVKITVGEFSTLIGLSRDNVVRSLKAGMMPEQIAMRSAYHQRRMSNRHGLKPLQAGDVAPSVTAMIGSTFGSLTVLSLAGRRNRKTLWRCRCECGKASIVIGTNLRTGKTKSCGCLRGKNTRAT